ncbi:MAG: HAD family hydrolase [Pseudobdellovibrionaceae bacterium]|nr:MAG: HAD family hydrolase [Pseudobdellovibrionaceae bacterium]
MTFTMNLVGIDESSKQILEHVEPYEHIIWDWNGTLLNDAHIAVEVVGELLEEHGLPSIDLTQYRDLFGFPVKDSYEVLGFDFSEISFEELSDRFMDRYHQRSKDHAQPFLGIEAILKSIAENKQQSILSAAAQWHLDELTRHFSLHHHFHNIYGLSDHYAHSKVERGRELVAGSTVPREKTILIGDTDHDWHVAEAVGIDVLLIADGHQSYERLIAAHSNVLASRFK